MPNVLESHSVLLGREKNYADCVTEDHFMPHVGLSWDFKDCN